MARFVLVHGGFSGAWIWLPLIDSLKAAGHWDWDMASAVIWWDERMTSRCVRRMAN
jgi:hypothetical protein